jgi:putative serine protease PepD
MDRRTPGRFAAHGAFLSVASACIMVFALAPLSPLSHLPSASQAASNTVALAASTTDPLTALQQATINAAAEVSPKVVLVRSASGLGSGEVIDPRGFIVTNYHVLSGGETELAPPFSVTLSTNKTYAASVAGTDAADDLAVLKINAGTLKPIAFADSSKLKVGQFVLVVGNPLGYAQSVTFGIISTLGRGLRENGPAAYLPDLIQTSAPINPGNSGGAMVDLQGRLAGIPVLAAVDPRQGSAAQGIGFAIPANRIRFITDQIIKTGKVTNTGRADLGITGADVATLARQYVMPVDHGAEITGVDERGPAAQAGLQQGDLITAINGKQVDTYQDLLDRVEKLRAGDKVQLQIVGPEGNQRTVSVTLGALPSEG